MKSSLATLALAAAASAGDLFGKMFDPAKGPSRRAFVRVSNRNGNHTKKGPGRVHRQGKGRVRHTASRFHGEGFRVE